MIISKFTPDQNSIKQELEVLNNILNEQRKLKKTLLLYLEKISEGIFNATDPQDANSLVSCLNSIKKSFENLKGNINEIIELKHYLEDALYTNSLDNFSLDEYNSKYLELFEKISDDNVFYYSFIESLLKFMCVVFPENVPEIHSDEYDYNKKIEEIAEKNILEPSSSEDTTERTLVETLPINDDIEEVSIHEETSDEPDNSSYDEINSFTNSENNILEDNFESYSDENINDNISLSEDIADNNFDNTINTDEDIIDNDLDNNVTIEDEESSLDDELESSLLEEIVEGQLLLDYNLLAKNIYSENLSDTSDNNDTNSLEEDFSLDNNSLDNELDDSENISENNYDEISKDITDDETLPSSESISEDNLEEEKISDDTLEDNSILDIELENSLLEGILEEQLFEDENSDVQLLEDEDLEDSLVNQDFTDTIDTLIKNDVAQDNNLEESENIPEDNYDEISKDNADDETLSSNEIISEDNLEEEQLSDDTLEDNSILDIELENLLLEEIIEEQLFKDENSEVQSLEDDVFEDSIIDKDFVDTIDTLIKDEVIQDNNLEDSENSLENKNTQDIELEDSLLEEILDEQLLEDKNNEVSSEESNIEKIINDENFLNETLNISLSDDSSNNIIDILDELIIDDNLSQAPAFTELANTVSVDEHDIEEDDDSIQEETSENIEIPEFVEKMLIVYEKDNKAILPYSILELEECFSNNPEKYSSIQDIIDKEYTVSTTNYKNTSFVRFKTTFNLAKNKSNLSFIESLNLSNELFFNSNAEPIIIAACKNTDELDIYLSCLADNVLEDFKCFEIKYI